jgi:hypothetical protein
VTNYLLIYLSMIKQSSTFKWFYFAQRTTGQLGQCWATESAAVHMTNSSNSWPVGHAHSQSTSMLDRNKLIQWRASGSLRWWLQSSLSNMTHVRFGRQTYCQYIKCWLLVILLSTLWLSVIRMSALCHYVYCTLKLWLLVILMSTLGLSVIWISALVSFGKLYIKIMTVGNSDVDTGLSVILMSALCHLVICMSKLWLLVIWMLAKHLSVIQMSAKEHYTKEKGRWLLCSPKCQLSASLCQFGQFEACPWLSCLLIPRCVFWSLIISVYLSIDSQY